IERVEPRAAEALERELVFQLATSVDGLHAREGAERMEVLGIEVSHTRVMLGQRDDRVARVELADESDRARPSDREGQRGAREQNASSEREHGDRIAGNRDAV